MLVYPSGLHLSQSTLRLLRRELAARRHRIGTCWRPRDKLSAGQKAVNRAQAKIRALGDQAMASHKIWRLLRKLLCDVADSVAQMPIARQPADVGHLHQVGLVPQHVGPAAHLLAPRLGRRERLTASSGPTSSAGRTSTTSPEPSSGVPAPGDVTRNGCEANPTTRRS